MKRVIGIFGVPRSGTSWLGQIFNSSPETRFAYQPMFAEAFRDQIHARSTAEEMRGYLKKIYDSQQDFLTQEDGKAKSRRLVFNKNSDSPEVFVFKEVMYLYMIPRFLRNLPEMKVILLLRNPYDVLKSWYNAPKEFYPEWDIEEEWRFAQSKNWFLPERYYGFHRWQESIVLASQLEREFPDRVYILKYEDLDEAPIEYAMKIFDFCELAWQEQTNDFITQSRNETESDPYSVFRNPVDRKKSMAELPENIKMMIQQEMNLFSEAESWYQGDYN